MPELKELYRTPVAEAHPAEITVTVGDRPIVYRKVTWSYDGQDVALRYGEWIINDCPHPTGRFSASGMQSVFLTELTAVSGIAKYADFARELMAEQVKLQIIAPGKPDRHGGYRGEDENPVWYVKGAKATDFVVTRTTVYSTLALFRLAGLSHGPSYSALGLKELRAAARKK